MTATYRLKGLGWLALVAMAALGFYLISLQVSVERKKLEHVNRQIVVAQSDIRSLQTEFSTRSNLAQLERWNGDVLALTAPTAAQYMPSGQALATLGSEAGNGPRVEMASLIIPTLPTIVAPTEPVSAPARATVETAAATVTKPQAVKVETASIKPTPDPLAAIVKAAALHPATPSTAARTKAEAVAMLDRKLLSDSTLGDLMSRARVERASLR